MTSLAIKKRRHNDDVTLNSKLLFWKFATSHCFENLLYTKLSSRFVRLRSAVVLGSKASKELVRSDGWSCPVKCYQESVTCRTLAPTGVLSGMFVKYLCLSNFGGESLRSCTLMRTLSVPVRAGSPPSVATICTGSMTLSLCLRTIHILLLSLTLMFYVLLYYIRTFVHAVRALKSLINVTYLTLINFLKFLI